ncbi:MAG: amidohydrolase [Acidobacteriota bacterium]
MVQHEELGARVKRAVEELEDRLKQLSRDLHDHPELSLHETRSSSRLQEMLRAGGFRVEAGVAGLPTAFVAVREGRAGKGPRIAFLAEYDALPGIGHACGHNLIAAAGVGAGLALSRLADNLPGEILVVGTPAEETLGGKCVMVRKGVFEGIDAALMIHPGTHWRVEVDSLACITLEVTFQGKEAHAVAWPEKGINALDALIQLFVAVDMMRKRLGRDVKIPGIIREGGVRPNIVPARTVGQFTLRAPSGSSRDEVRRHFEHTVGGIAAATGCGFSLRATDEPYDDMVTNKTMADVFRSYLKQEGVTTVEGERPNKGSLDMGNVSRAVPSLHPFVAICEPDVASHSAAFAAATITPRAEKALMIAVRALALTGLDLLVRPDLLQRTRVEFTAATA